MTDETLLPCVVGSGPSGVACAHALLERGARVRLLDAGLSLEPERAELVARLREVSPESWRPDQLAPLKQGTDPSNQGQHKLAYGSDFPYRGGDVELGVEYEGVALRPSLAEGGLSNVWGAVMMPYVDRDTNGWPIRLSQLADHYAAALKLTGLSSRHDDLEAMFPLYQAQSAALRLSRQAEILLGRLERHRERLSRSGIFFGQARLAVRSAPPSPPGCVYCGLCLYGCPYGCIYNSASTVRELQRNPRFIYEPAVIVTKVAERDSAVRIEGRRLDGAPWATEASRVYLAAGVIPTTQILLRSQSRYDETVWMQDSRSFLLPLLLFTRARDVREERGHSLCQVFLEIVDSSVSPCTVHLQIYSYSELIGQAVRDVLGPLARPLGRLARNLEGRLLVIQGYIHSQHSARIGVTLRGGSPDRLHLKAQANPDTQRVIRRVVRKLLRHARQLGAVALSPMLQIREPGYSFHTGGSIPMREHPGPLESDVLGRPHGWTRVHAVDATVLPSIPATSITLSVMANAHRIGSETAAWD